MKEKFERFKNEKIVVNVRSQKQYDKFMKLCEKQGLKWNSGDLPTKNNVYNSNKENTYIDLNNLNCLTYGGINFYKNDDYKIITYEDFMKEESNQFTKSDLKDNHIVVYENGYKKIWSENPNKCIVNEDLTSKSKMFSDIIEVYEFDKLVWKREEVLDEVEKKYLSDFVRPYKVKYIEKNENVRENLEYLNIKINGEVSIGETISLPYFKKGTMYKGLELNKKYTIKELGL